MVLAMAGNCRSCGSCGSGSCRSCKDDVGAILGAVGANGAEADGAVVGGAEGAVRGAVEDVLGTVCKLFSSSRGSRNCLQQSCICSTSCLQSCRKRSTIRSCLQQSCRSRSCGGCRSCEAQETLGGAGAVGLWKCPCTR
jgi:hypothetical protein